ASWWTSHFVRTTDRGKYAVISHALSAIPDAPMVVRSSILDLLDVKNYWKDSRYISNPVTVSNGRLNVTSGSYFGIRALSEDTISQMNTYRNGESYSFDISFNATSKALLNVGGNMWQIGGYKNTQWGLPACRTSGSLSINGKKLTIDTEKSLTWYDRQWSPSDLPPPTGPVLFGNFIWFELHFSKDIKASIWSYDHRIDKSKSRRFATVRTGSGLMMLPFTLETTSKRFWTSPLSKITYPLQWTLLFAGGDFIDIESVREDQELYGDAALMDSIYAGVVTAKGKFLGETDAFGIVEMVSDVP
ncbi:hypothetical protein EJ08DRAFT_598586, partial [Tothia fuscella]